LMSKQAQAKPKNRTRIIKHRPKGPFAAVPPRRFYGYFKPAGSGLRLSEVLLK
jgi:hypothetical protein